MDALIANVRNSGIPAGIERLEDLWLIEGEGNYKDGVEIDKDDLKGLREDAKMPIFSEADVTFPMDHILSDHMEKLIPEDVITSFLADRKRCTRLVLKMMDLAMLLGITAQDDLPPYEDHEESRPYSWWSSCQGCGAGYYGGPNTEQRRLVEYVDGRTHSTVYYRLHKTTVVLEVILNLLTNFSEHSHHLVGAILDIPDDMKDESQVLKALPDDSTDNTVGMIFGLLVNCSRPFPKVAGHAAAILSLASCRRPANAFVTLNYHSSLFGIHRYFRRIHRLLELGAQEGEDAIYFRLGVACFINVLPILYLLGDWHVAREDISQTFYLPGFILSSIVEIYKGFAVKEGGDPALNAGPLDPWSKPPLVEARICLEPILKGTANADWRIDMARTKPLSFACACALEVLGYWQNKGVDVCSAPIRCDFLEDLTVAKAMQMHFADFQTLIGGVENAAYASDIASSIREGKTPSLPSFDKSILGGGLHGYMTCAYPLCHRTSCTNGLYLKACSGGCCGLARYCSSEHQRAHWKKGHKAFCKRNEDK